jgi:hypothetical protein
VIEEALAGLFVVIEDAACVRNGSMLLKKLPKKCCGIKLRNNRIRQADPLNQHCAFEADIESIFPSEAAKILFQQHRPNSEVSACQLLCRVSGAQRTKYAQFEVSSF